MAFIVCPWVWKIVVLLCFVGLMALATMRQITDTSPSLSSSPPDHLAAHQTVQTTSVSASGCDAAGISPFGSAASFDSFCSSEADKAKRLTRGLEVQKITSQDASPFLDMLDKRQHQTLVDQIEGCEMFERYLPSPAEQAWCATIDQPEVSGRLELALKRATHEGNIEAHTLLAQLWLVQAKRVWMRSNLPRQQDNSTAKDTKTAMLTDFRFQESLQRIDALLRNAGPGGNTPAPMHDSLVGAGYLKK